MDRLKDSDDAAAAVATAPRVTLEQMEADMASVEYHVFHGILTLCIVKMKNGFYLVGESAPASPENFNAELGRKFAYENAVKQLWKLEGYALRERLARGMPS